MKHIGILTLFIALCCVSCDKVNVGKSKHPEWAGDYDWAYSESLADNAAIDLTNSDRYGFRVKSGGRVLFFKNGKHDFSGHVKQADQRLVIRANGEDWVIVKEEGQIRSEHYPHGGYSNVFLKTK